MIACGALSTHAGELIDVYGWPIDVHPINPLIHNRPERITDAVAAKHAELADRYRRVVVGFADCGTYGELGRWCAEHEVELLPGLHCYDLYAGDGAVAELLAEEPGTYLLTDFMVRSFDRIVIQELGLDRHPELHDDYFRHYRRALWLAQERTPELEALAREQAAFIGVPLEVVETGLSRLAEALESVLRAPDRP